jgi:putative DNA primase/helicase
MMLGRCAGGAVRLAPATSVLAVTEGIETGLSVLQATGIPTWAALSAPGMAALRLPALPMAAEVIIFADHDAVGIRAAEAAIYRWHGEGRVVRLARPSTPGTDFNDVLRGAA